MEYFTNKLTQGLVKPFLWLTCRPDVFLLLATIGPSSCPSSPLTGVKANPTNHSSLTSTGLSRAPADHSQMEVAQEWLDIQAPLHRTEPESHIHRVLAAISLETRLSDSAESLA